MLSFQRSKFFEEKDESDCDAVVAGDVQCLVYNTSAMVYIEENRPLEAPQSFI